MATVSTRGRRRETQRPVPPPNDIQAPLKPEPPVTVSFMEPDKRHAQICEAAYFRAERRGFCPGQELDDWLAAEGEIDRTQQSGGAGS